MVQAQLYLSTLRCSGLLSLVMCVGSCSGKAGEPRTKYFTLLCVQSMAVLAMVVGLCSLWGEAAIATV